MLRRAFPIIHVLCVYESMQRKRELGRITRYLNMRSARNSIDSQQRRPNQKRGAQVHPLPPPTVGEKYKSSQVLNRIVHLHCTLDSKGEARRYMLAGGQEALGSKHNRGRNRNKAAREGAHKAKKGNLMVHVITVRRGGHYQCRPNHEHDSDQS